MSSHDRNCLSPGGINPGSFHPGSCSHFFSTRPAHYSLLLTALLLVGGVCLVGQWGNQASARQRQVTVRTDRWLKVQQLGGQVTFQQSRLSRPAKQGDRLQSVGDGITTGRNSASTLAVDTGVGFVRLGENTQVSVRSLQLASDNGRITYLDVLRGQVRLQVRRFTHSGSKLEIRTPAGVGAVRGTQFGVSVQPDGKTGIATLNGKVTMAAQGRAVSVDGGFQTFTIPGEPPLPPVPLRDDTGLRYRLERGIQAGVRELRWIGQVDPVNAVLVGNVPQKTDRNGQFTLLIPASSTQTLQVTVITPLGKQQVHDLMIRL